MRKYKPLECFKCNFEMEHDEEYIFDGRNCCELCFNELITKAKADEDENIND